MYACMNKYKLFNRLNILSFHGLTLAILQEQLKMIGLQMTAKFQSTPIRDRDIEVFFANTFNELEMHFQRLIVASE